MATILLEYVRGFIGAAAAVARVFHLCLPPRFWRRAGYKDGVHAREAPSWAAESAIGSGGLAGQEPLRLYLRAGVPFPPQPATAMVAWIW